MIYNVLPFLKFDVMINEIAIIEQMNNYITELSIPITRLKIFDDCDINGYYIDPNPDNESQYYSDDEFSVESDDSDSFVQRRIEEVYWSVDLEGNFSYDKPTDDTVDYFPLSTLQYILNEFLRRGRSVSGYVVVYNRNIDGDFEEHKALYYKVENSKLIYHINKTQELTRHWKNVISFKGGITVNDIYPFNNEVYYYPNSFINFLMNNLFPMGLEQLNIETSEFIFNNTFKNVD